MLRGRGSCIAQVEEFVQLHPASISSYLLPVLSRPSYALLVVLSLAASVSRATVVHRVHQEGEGRPTVIFENGLGDTLEVWKSVQSSISSDCTRTLSYNRAGYQGSDPARTARDA